MTRDTFRIGGACGFWGEASYATEQLLTDPSLDFLVYDYLAEITLSIMARARAKDPALGYATDFIRDAMRPNLPDIARRGIRVLSNAGGMNPHACADALRAEIARLGLSLRVAVVTGDDLTDQIGKMAEHREMFSGAPFPDQKKVQSINAYLGAGPIVAALNAGADIVVTGRCVDSALTLAACMHAFDWGMDQLDALAAGSLAGHLLECGPQTTGGNFTDWQNVPDPANIGYPIVQIASNGEFTVEKPAHTGGLVTRETVGEQMLYEIGDPAAYQLPDVSCDFTGVTLQETTHGKVKVTGARGYPPTGKLKVSTTWLDGYRAGQVLNFNGCNAREKGVAYTQAVLARVHTKLENLGLGPFDKISIECFGGQTETDGFEEVAVTAAVKHQDARAVGVFLKELIGAALATPPGLHFFTGAGRPKPSPVVALFSSLIDTNVPDITLSLDGEHVSFSPAVSPPHGMTATSPAPRPHPTDADADLIDVRLDALAIARSGDKGDAVNIGVMARVPAYMPWIWAALTPDRIAACFGDQVKGPVERFFLPGIQAMNIQMRNALDGGGIASLRNDSQGKGFAQRLLSVKIAIPRDLLPNTLRSTL